MLVTLYFIFWQVDSSDIDSKWCWGTCAVTKRNMAMLIIILANLKQIMPECDSVLQKVKYKQYIYWGMKEKSKCMHHSGLK